MIDYQAGVRHAAKLLEDGAEVQAVVESLSQRPRGPFRDGMKAVLDDPVVLAELLKIRDGVYSQPKHNLNMPELSDKDIENEKIPRIYMMSHTGNPYPGLRQEKGYWFTRRYLKGKRYNTARFEHYADAVEAWKTLTAHLEELLRQSSRQGS